MVENLSAITGGTFILYLTPEGTKLIYAYIQHLPSLSCFIFLNRAAICASFHSVQVTSWMHFNDPMYIPQAKLFCLGLI